MNSLALKILQCSVEMFRDNLTTGRCLAFTFTEKEISGYTVMEIIALSVQL